MTRGVSVCGKAAPSSEGGFRKQQYPSRCVWDSVELVRVHEHLEEDLTVFALSVTVFLFVCFHAHAWGFVYVKTHRVLCSHDQAGSRKVCGPCELLKLPVSGCMLLCPTNGAGWLWLASAVDSSGLSSLLLSGNPSRPCTSTVLL